MGWHGACVALVLSRHQNKEWPSYSTDEGLTTGDENFDNKGMIQSAHVHSWLKVSTISLLHMQ